MKLVLTGGTGHLGQVLATSLQKQGHEIVVVTRGPANGPGVLQWDGRTFGPWAQALCEANTPATRKVALRSAIVMSPERGGVFDILMNLTRFGLGGTIAGGRQFVSWIHDRDFARAVDLPLARDDISGPVNLAAPRPLPQRAFMAALRTVAGMPIGVPATAWMFEIAAFVQRTETELLLKSRRVVPGRLLEAGFQFEHPAWPGAATDLVARWRQGGN